MNVSWRELGPGYDLDMVIFRELIPEMFRPGANASFDDDSGDYYAIFWVPEDGKQRVFSILGMPSKDVDAAIDMLWTDDARWGIGRDYDDPTKFCATYPGHGDQDAGWEIADTPALAICRAYLAWKEFLKGQSK